VDTYIVYKAEFTNGKSYIGITSKSLEHRKEQHISKALNDKGFTLHKAIRKYGKDSMSWSILEQDLPKHEAEEKERYWISTLNTTNDAYGYNILLGGNIAQNPEHISKKQKEFYSSRENREKSGIWHGGKPFIVYDFVEEQVIGRYESQNLCAEELNIEGKNLNKVLKGHHSNCSRYTFIHEDEWSEDKLLEKLANINDRVVHVYNIDGTKIKSFMSVLSCATELKIPRQHIYKASKTGKAIQDMKFIIKDFKVI
jgi:group I intron endonuclease